MEDGASNGHNNQTLTKNRSRATTSTISATTYTSTRRSGGHFAANKTIKKGKKQCTVEDREAPDDEDEDGDPEVWSRFSKSFGQVQSVLDRNRVLIQQVNENHQSKTSDNLVKNVALIQEINGNIAKVVSLYSDLSSDFSNMFHHRKQEGKNGDKQLNDKSQ